jgi:hypothetical protein
MSRPTILYIGSDGSPSGPNGKPKVHLRALLYSTSKRGRVIESLYVKLSRNETTHIFNVWVYGDKDLSRGSGMFIGETGVATNHHFLLPRDDTNFNYPVGRYHLELFASLVGRSCPQTLFSQEVEITVSDSAALRNGNAGLYFDWSPSTQRFISHVQIIEPLKLPPLSDFIPRMQ